MGGDVTLSCWFCRLKGAEYSFLPKSSGNLLIAAKKGQTEDLGTVQSFDVDRTIVLCSVSPCDLGMYEPEWATDILPPNRQNHNSEIADLVADARQTRKQRPVRFELSGSGTPSAPVIYSCLLTGSMVPADRRQRSR
jgi:hypothetical protein